MGEMKKKIGVFLLFLVVFAFLLTITPVKAATIVDIEGGAGTPEVTTEATTEAKTDLNNGSNTFGSNSGSFYLDESGTLHIGQTVTEQGFFNHLFGKLLQGLNAAQIVSIIIVIFLAVIIVVLLIVNIIGDKKKVGFYLFGLLACGLGVVFIYFAKDIFAAFVSWTAN